MYNMCITRDFLAHSRLSTHIHGGRDGGEIQRVVCGVVDAYLANGKFSSPLVLFYRLLFSSLFCEFVFSHIRGCYAM